MVTANVSWIQLSTNPSLSKWFKVDEFEISPHACRAAKNSFYARGEQISTWAQQHGFSKDLVYSVLAGRSKAHRGQAHKIAVALGLKPQPSNLLDANPTSAKEG